MWLFSWWFYFREFCESVLAKISISIYMAIYNNENILKIANLSLREFPNLVQNRENICTRKLWRIQCMKKFILFFISLDIEQNVLSYDSVNALCKS